jgi:hypothetical protein
MSKLRNDDVIKKYDVNVCRLKVPELMALKLFFMIEQVVKTEKLYAERLQIDEI